MAVFLVLFCLFAGRGVWAEGVGFLPPVAAEAEPYAEPPEPKIARPDRPLDFPSLPGRVEAPLSIPFEGGVEGSYATHQEGEATDGKALAIRFATLPGAKVRSIPDKRISRPALDRQREAEAVLATKAADAKKKAEAEKAKQAASEESCRALTDMRRRQLEAMESDRRTLAALHEALKDMGLVDKMSFMSQGESVPAPDPALGLAAASSLTLSAPPVAGAAAADGH